MKANPLGVGVVGSGMISGIYLKNMINRFGILDVKALTSSHMENARRRADEFGLPARTYEDMLADDDIDLIVNLTPTPAHEGIIRQALEAGKHVYTEKTLTADGRSARELLALAQSKGLWLGSAPDTFLGAALQTARSAIDGGLIGEVTSFAFAANRDYNFLTPFFTFLNLPSGGITYDYAVYYLTALCALLGPVEKVAASVRAPYPTHLDINPKSATCGQQISTPNESEISAVLVLKSGVAGTAHVNGDSVIQDQHFFAIYGTAQGAGMSLRVRRQQPRRRPGRAGVVRSRRAARPRRGRNGLPRAGRGGGHHRKRADGRLRDPRFLVQPPRPAEAGRGGGAEHHGIGRGQRPISR